MWLAKLAESPLKQHGVTTDPVPALQFELGVEAIRLLHRSVSGHLENWPRGPDPRERQARRRRKTVRTAARVDCSFDHAGQESYGRIT